MKSAALFFLFCAAPAALAEAGAAPAPMNMAEAEAIALQHAPEIAAAYFKAEAAKQVVRETRADFFPQVNAEIAAVGTGDGINREFDGGADSATPATLMGVTGGLNTSSVYNRESNGITIIQLITDFGRTANLTAASKFIAQSESEKALLARAVVLFQVDKAYLKTLESETLLTVARETVAARTVVLDQTKALVDSKLKSELDLSIADVSVEQASLLLVQAQSAVDQAQTELSIALGFHDPRRFPLIETPPGPVPSTDVKNLVAEALQYRPEILALKAETAGATRFSSAEREARFPKITAMASGGRTPLGDSSVVGNYSAAGINVEVPLFDGGRLSARYQKALLDQRATQKRLEQEELQVIEDVNVAWLELQAASKKISVTQKLFASANEALSLANSKYKLGSISMVDLSQAQLNDTEARIACTGAKYEYQMQSVKLEFLSGAPKFRPPPPDIR